MIKEHIIQESYPQPAGTAYLNTSSAGLVSRSGIEASHSFNRELLERGSTHAEQFYIQEIPKIRNAISHFIGTAEDELALIPNFSYGISAVIPSLSKLKRVLLYQNDYPSLTLPFELNEFELFWLKDRDGFLIDLNEIEESIIKNKIDILAISHVQYLTGYTIDIASLSSICKQHNVLLLVDATQSLGAFPFYFNQSGINILITSNYKWMNSGYGSGLLCIDRETQEKYPSKLGGFNSYKYFDGAWNFAPGIHSYEPGHLNMAGLMMLKDAVDFKIKIGIDNIGHQNQGLLRHFIDNLNLTKLEIVGCKDISNRKNIIGIIGDQQLEKFLIQQGIIIKMRQNIVRIGFHFYNTTEDVDRLLDALHAYDLHL